MPRPRLPTNPNVPLLGVNGRSATSATSPDSTFFLALLITQAFKAGKVTGKLIYISLVSHFNIPGAPCLSRLLATGLIVALTANVDGIFYLMCDSV